LQFKNLRKRVKRLCRLAKINYYRNEINSQLHNPKQLWKSVSSLIGKTQKAETFACYDTNGSIISDTGIIADKFNKLFSTIGSNLAKSIPPSNVHFTSYLSGSYLDSFLLFPTDEYEVTTAIMQLKNKYSTDFDDISIPIIKAVCNTLALPLTMLINASFSLGIFPDDLKIAKICPVFKAGSRFDLSNFRPISVLPVFSKVFEKLVYSRLINYLTKSNIIVPNQFGFIKGFSTSMALTDFYDKISKYLENNEFAIGVFIDLQKAFDTLDHSILLRKLNHYGVRGVALNWFTSYLHGRTQCVSIANSTSALLPITCGVPQGSILGPLLFLLYINDIINSSSLLQFTLFADDTNLLHHNKSLPVLVTQLNFELICLSTWFSANKLSLNANKTKFILFGNRHLSVHDQALLQINIDGVVIERVEFIKFLGVFIDAKLNWHKHILETSKKVSCGVMILNKTKDFLPLSVRMNLYYAFIYSHLSYCNIVWGFASPSTLNCLFMLQKKAVRLVSKSSYRDHTNPLFRSLSLLKLFDIYKLQVCLFILKCKHLHTSNPSLPFYQHFFFSSVNKNYNTRCHPLNLTIPFCKSSVRKCAILFSGPLIWNSLPDHVKSVDSYSSFKLQFTSYCTSLYQP
jgi:hypothetical protein